MQHKQGFYEKYVKRLIDIVCSLVALVLFWWLYIILAVLVRFKLGVRPGLTGYAQAHGRNAVSWEEKFDMDVWYVNHVSMRTDIRVIIDTIKTVLSKEGISSETSVTMEEFMGSK